MSNEKEPTAPESGESADNTTRELSPAARRAIAEAEARRRKGAFDPNLPPERQGRKGPEPTRYGDWEKDGIVSDF